MKQVERPQSSNLQYPVVEWVIISLVKPPTESKTNYIYYTNNTKHLQILKNSHNGRLLDNWVQDKDLIVNFILARNKIYLQVNGHQEQMLQGLTD